MTATVAHPGTGTFTVHLPERAEPYVLGTAVELGLAAGGRLWAVINGVGFEDTATGRRYRATAHGSFAFDLALEGAEGGPDDPRKSILE